MINNYNAIANIYAKHENVGTAYLAYKYLCALLAKYAQGSSTLDFGCGTGSSTRFLNDIGLDVCGVDINDAMLTEARSHNDNIIYKKINAGKIPYENNTFDIVFSAFVLLEVDSKERMLNILNEIYRVLNNGGIFIAVTGSTEMYSNPWLSLDCDFEQNKNLKSGDIAKVHLREIDLSVYDYYWTHQDYEDVINETQFTLLEHLFPLGNKSDPYPWVTEETKSPYVIYVLKKKI